MKTVSKVIKNLPIFGIISKKIFNHVHRSAARTRAWSACTTVTRRAWSRPSERCRTLAAGAASTTSTSPWKALTINNWSRRQTNSSWLTRRQFRPSILRDELILWGWMFIFFFFLKKRFRKKLFLFLTKYQNKKPPSSVEFAGFSSTR